MVERVSKKYRGEAVNLAHADELTARAMFWFPRDLGKVARPVWELCAVDALPLRPLRILDLGAGLGATSLGVLRALPEGRTVAHITAVDRDAEALSLLQRIARGAHEQRLISSLPEIVTHAGDLSDAARLSALGRFDLVTVGLSLVEHTRALGDEHARGAALAATLTALLERVEDDGALLVIEPADHDSARPLQRARDTLVSAGVTVFAPCPHARGCPMLTRPRDWCHEDIADASLPLWLIPVARAAGLRWEGLTYSYLVLRRDTRTLAGRAARPRMLPARLISAPTRTKGKTEVTLCGAFGADVTLGRAMELHRDRAKGEDAFDALPRGATVLLPDDAAEGIGQGGQFRVRPGAWARFQGI